MANGDGVADLITIGRGSGRLGVQEAHFPAVFDPVDA
jgi:hypothetical protein